MKEPTFPASYTGPPELQSALIENSAKPLALAAADFDEDGTPDLVSGYALDERGLLTLHRGNVDAIYPHSAEAQARRAEGTGTTAPFLTPAMIFALAAAPDFVSVGDFNGDGHWDVLAAGRGGSALYFLLGDGHGQLAAAREIAMPGAVTALVAGEINRADGLADVVVALNTEKGASVLVFEGPDGALNSAPESFALPAAVNSLVLGQFDDAYEMDLAIAAGRELFIVHGRDRKLSLEAAQRQSVPAARIDERDFTLTLMSAVAGDFTGDQQTDLALLLEDGSMRVLSRGRVVAPSLSATERATTALSEETVVNQELLAQSAPQSQSNQTTNRQSRVTRRISAWDSHLLSSGAGPQAAKLVSARVTGLPGEDLLVIDAAGNQLHLLVDAERRTVNGAQENGAATPESVTFDVDGGAVAVLPMHLNSDALTDLVLLRQDASGVPTILLTGEDRSSPLAPPLSPPPRATSRRGAPITRARSSLARRSIRASGVSSPRLRPTKSDGKRLRLTQAPLRRSRPKLASTRTLPSGRL